MTDDSPHVPSTATIRKAPKPPKPKAKMGRRPKAVVCDRCQQAFASAGEARGHECSNPKPMGRPRKTAAAEPAEAPAPAPPAEPHSKGYTRIFVDEHGADLAVPITEETEVRRHAPAPAPVAPSVELAIPADLEMRRMIDEYGELDRRRQLHASDDVRYETLKRAIKSWFDQAPPDADGSVRGDNYFLHLSQRERERQVRSVRELVDLIGIDAVLDLVVVPITKLEDGVGKSRVEHLIVEARTGSRRIRCIPMFPATRPSDQA